MPRPGDSVDPLFLTFQSALAGRYSIDRELGRGGMGIVYLAREVHLDRAVAISFSRPIARHRHSSASASCARHDSRRAIPPQHHPHSRR
jgi:serine/threonine-protein kinase